MLTLPSYHSVSHFDPGGDSARYRAIRASDGAPVVLKVLGSGGSRVVDRARVKHEYKHIAQIESERVVKVYGVEEHDGELVLVLEDTAGDELGSYLAARGRLDVGACLDLAISMAEAVRVLHGHGIVHGAVRPKSFLVAGGGQARILNYGVDAAITHEGESLYSEAVLSDVLPYLSPEQTGRMNRGVDHRSDLYSLGVLFYRMLTGALPFEASDPLELIHAHIALVPEHPAAHRADVPATLGDVVMKLLSKNAEDRYQSASGLVADLRECHRRIERGRIERFDLGQRDAAYGLQIHQKLYGREEGIRRLTEAFHAVLCGARKVVLVSGYSGIGKSSLVQEILKPLAREKGYYISGKYDQYNRDRPLGPVLQAFDALLRQILSESEERIARWRAAMIEGLGSNAQVICEVLPALDHLVGAQPPLPSLGPVEAQNRLNLTFQRFVSVFTSQKRPIVLFLDDLQWIDAASLSLVNALLEADGLGAFFFCGAYRDNEVSSAHPFIRAVEDLRKGGVEIEPIVLTPLELPHVTALLGDSLGRSDVGQLAALVLKKTGGNPFFIKRFLKTIHDSGAMSFDQAGRFSWDLAAIGALEYTDNVLDLMASNIRRLPAPAQDALKLAAAIGNRFDLGTLATVSACSVDAFYARVEPALKEELITSDGALHRFVHDKIQEAAYSMIPVEERPSLHHRIGTLLKEALGPDARGLFDVVNHLNRAGDLLSDPGARLDLARMNLRAAERAEESSAFDAALKYLAEGIARLPADPWESEYELTFALTTKMGLLQALCGRPDDALATLDEPLARGRSRIDRTRAHGLKVRVHILKADLHAALEQGLVALRAFGIDLPPFPSDEAVAGDLDATLRFLEGRPMESLCDLPRLADPELAVLHGVLEEMISSCYFLASNNFGFCVMKILRDTVQYGVSQSSVFAYVLFGQMLCVSGRIELGYAFGETAVELHRRYNDKRNDPILACMWGAFVMHWRVSYEKGRELLFSGIHAGLETGQYVWTFYCMTNANTATLLLGRPLAEIEAESRSLLPIRKFDRWNFITWMVCCVGQICENLMSPDPGPTELAGEWVQIQELVDGAIQVNNQASLFFTIFYRLLLRLFQGDHAAAAALAFEANPRIMGIAGWQGNPAFHFYGGVALILAADSADPETRERYLDKAHAFGEKVAFWASHAPDNLRHRHLLLSAELARVRGDSRVALDLYDEGIRAAEEGGYLHDTALGNELCARCTLELGRATLARAYMMEAHAAYARWGAASAMVRLERAYPELLRRELPVAPAMPAAPAIPAAPAMPAAPGTIPPVVARDDLDVRSVLKASQALSGEIVLPRLLEALMRIMLENAGARRGFLILKTDGGLTIEAAGDVAGERIERVASVPLGSRSDLAASVIQYVARTEESVVIDDAPSDPSFAQDPYVRAARPRSLLASPISHQGRVIGIVYLENALASAAFTRDRVELIRLLSAQIAVSLENARLFAQLEEKVEARTAELRAAHAELRALYATREREQEERMLEQRALIEQQREVIHALSAPILQVWDGVLAVPLIGALDGERASELMQSLLDAVSRGDVRFALLDITGVETIDEAVADHLVRIMRAVELLGVRPIVTGIRPAVARTMTSLDVDLRSLGTHATLRDALKLCMRSLAPR
ncbi:AAA family ATPase [Sorangium sp. So ce426]|uniref:AAA family ATPase n=1 Tax=unclassified Sorangium TaxID=2621164 RepID=UPI003F5C32E0